jgi:uncharacterized membrane protein
MPFHPSIVHLPIVLSFMLPFVMIFCFLMLKTQKSHHLIWALVIFLQGIVVLSGYLALESGEIEEDRVEKIVEAKMINQHEEAAEIFVGFSVIIFCLNIVAYFLKGQYQFNVMLTAIFLAFVSLFLGINVGSRGGDLVYKHGAGRAFLPDFKQEFHR